MMKYSKGYKLVSNQVGQLKPHKKCKMESLGYKEGREYVLEFTSAGNVIGYINPYLLSECTSKRKI